MCFFLSTNFDIDSITILSVISPSFSSFATISFNSAPLSLTDTLSVLFFSPMVIFGALISLFFFTYAQLSTYEIRVTQKKVIIMYLTYFICSSHIILHFSISFLFSKIHFSIILYNKKVHFSNLCIILSYVITFSIFSLPYVLLFLTFFLANHHINIY